MKKTVIFFLFVTFFSNAQVSIGKTVSPFNIYVSNHSKKTFEKLKTYKTYFVVPEAVDFEVLRNLVLEVWDFNELHFVKEKEFLKNRKKFLENNAVIQFIDDAYAKQKGSLSVAEYIIFKFSYRIYDKIKFNKKGYVKTPGTGIAEILFTPSILKRRGVVSKGGRTVLFTKSKVSEEPDSYNFNLGYIKNYFQTLNDYLNKGENLRIRDGIENKTKLKELKSKTLYIPEWILKKYDPFTINMKKLRKPEELFNKYEHEYRVLSSAEINQNIMDGKEFYYLMHTQFNNVKILSIINSLNGDIIYLSEKNGYNIKNSDIKSINKLINKV